MDLPLSVLSLIATTLEQHGIRYVLVGSFASSIHGMYRSTADIDMLRDTLDFEYLRKWAKELGIDDLLEKALDDVREDPEL